VIRLTILGQPCSKANSRELATIGPKDKRRTIFRKSDDALQYEASALKQIPPAARQQLQGPVRVTLHLYYETNLPDLDESIVLDVLQDRWASEKRDAAGNVTRPKTLLQKGVYLNDRQVREKHVFHGIDKRNPRTEVLVEPLQAQQQGLDLPEPAFADQLDPAGVAF
jgi:Holliday junction resolvase RusA-like endonuclease